MNYLNYIFVICFTTLPMSAQQMSGNQLLEKSIKYHDPQGQWKSFKDTLDIQLKRADGSLSTSQVIINLPEQYFSTTMVRKGVPTTYTINKDNCTTSIINPNPDAKRTPCETASLYKNYYTYLYGLPMKLKDPGTHISETIEKRKFKGTEYWVLKATYDAAVGNDVWFFYFNPSNFAMEVYQFYKGDPTSEGKNTGEYILLTEEVILSNIKMPKNRAWYFNKDDQYLGSDLLQSN